MANLPFRELPSKLKEQLEYAQKNQIPHEKKEEKEFNTGNNRFLQIKEKLFTFFYALPFFFLVALLLNDIKKKNTSQTRRPSPIASVGEVKRTSNAPPQEKLPSVNTTKNLTVGEFFKPGSIKQRLRDVKGIDEIMEQISDIIHMIENYEKYRKKGSVLPKGILLYGRPGTGKTLIARAIAGEAGVNFIHCTGSQFDELFVGVGASRVRELFGYAKNAKPCIIFIDEIDSLLA